MTRTVTLASAEVALLEELRPDQLSAWRSLARRAAAAGLARQAGESDEDLAARLTTQLAGTPLGARLAACLAAPSGERWTRARAGLLARQVAGAAAEDEAAATELLAAAVSRLVAEAA